MTLGMVHGRFSGPKMYSNNVLMQLRLLTSFLPYISIRATLRGNSTRICGQTPTSPNQRIMFGFLLSRWSLFTRKTFILAWGITHHGDGLLGSLGQPRLIRLFGYALTAPKFSFCSTSDQHDCSRIIPWAGMGSLSFPGRGIDPGHCREDVEH
jgi:hypothetical protein